MVAHGDKEIEEQLPASFHFHLHGAAALEGGPAADDQGKVVGAQLGVGVRRVGVGVASAGEDGAALDGGLEALFSECEAFEFVQSVFIGGAAVGKYVSQYRSTSCYLSVAGRQAGRPTN